MVSQDDTRSVHEYKLPASQGLAGEAHRIPAAATIALREANEPYAQLMVLADQFKLAAMAIDPTIKSVWVSTEIDGMDRYFSGIFVRREVTK